MRLLRLRIALGTFAAVMAAGCFVALAASTDGSPDLTPKPHDLAAIQTTDLFHLHTTWVFDDQSGEYDEWFSPGSGLFDVEIPLDTKHETTQSNDGKTAFIWDQGHNRRTEGSRAFLKALSQASINDRPGAALFYAYLVGDALKSRIEDGKLVISDDSWQPQENNDSTVQFETTVLERESESEALARHVFHAAKTKDLRRLRKAGQASSVPGVHAWWLGRRYDSVHAVTAWDEKTAKPEGSDPKRSYTTVYVGSKDVSEHQPGDWLKWPGFGYLNPDVIMVVSQPRNTKIGFDKEPEHDVPITLGDGSRGMLVTIGPLQWIRTRNALISLAVRYEPGLLSLARSLRPVK